MLSKSLINAANLHSGGAMQVAVSFINELIKIGEVEVNILVSSEINIELEAMNTQVKMFNSYKVYDVFGLKALFDYRFIKNISSYRVVFTIFGPLYSWVKPHTSIVGFAQLWIVCPENEVFDSYSAVGKALSRLKYTVQKYFYFNSDIMLVEANHVKQGLRRLSEKTNPVVVRNCISSVYCDPDQWKGVDYSQEKGGVLLLGIVARDYPHKNLKILPHVAELLILKYKIPVRFIVTLTEEEWGGKDQKFHQYVDNVGSISIAQCPSFYNLLDGVIFPSLLECFSATPIEAMIMKKPVFASDRLFVKEVCGDFVNYFDPNDAESIALSINNYFSGSKVKMLSFLDSAYDQAQEFNNPSKRAKKYIEIMKNI